MQAESNCVKHADIELVGCLELILAKLPLFFLFFYFYFLFYFIFYFLFSFFLLFFFL